MTLPVIEKLKQIHQEHLLKYWDVLSSESQKKLLAQIGSLEPSLFLSLRQQVLADETPISESIAPFHDYAHSGSAKDFELGKQLIAEGKVGCLIVAGGQGSRLGGDDPKGMFPVSLIKHKTLFQLFAERTKAAGIQAGCLLPLAIMTSPLNHQQIVSYFESHGYFGLQESQVFFFSQGMLPLLDQKGDLFLEAPDKIAQGPDGNGSVLKHFVDQGIWVKWKKRGVHFVNFVLIDNPLADPFDAELIGFHERQKGDLVIKCVQRKSSQEKVGVVVKKEGKVCVVEYTELPPSEREAIEADGSLRHSCANISLFSFRMEFIEKVAKQYADQMPFHKALKAVKYLTAEGVTKKSDKPQFWKFEKFIFDLLSDAQNVKALLYPREQCFAPLKNAEGSDGLDDVQRALQKFDREVFAQLSGVGLLPKAFELDPQFYYPTQERLTYWKGKMPPDAHYVNF